LLFAADRPLSVKAVKELLETIDVQGIRDVIESLIRRYDQDGHSFQIVEVAGGYQLCTRPQFAKWIKGLYRSRSRTRLSKAALETLAIIAYKQPIAKGEVESLRGVRIDGVIQTLLMHNLITIRGRKLAVGRPLLYGTTDEFLRYFGLNQITDLPTKDELHSLTDGLKATEGMVTEYENPIEQILGPERKDVQTPGGSLHPGGPDPG